MCVSACVCACVRWVHVCTVFSAMLESACSTSVMHVLMRSGNYHRITPVSVLFKLHPLGLGIFCRWLWHMLWIFLTSFLMLPVQERQRHQKVLGDLRDAQGSSMSAASTPSSTSSGLPHSLVLPNQGDILEQSMHGSAYSRQSVDSPDGLASDKSFRSSTLPLAVGMEHLQSLLKQREGEVTALQSQVALLEKARSSVSEELMSVASDNEQLHQKLEHLPVLKRQVDSLDKRYNTMLQMYGEKAEECNELRMDLEDVKSMYKQQIQDLLSRGYH